MAIHIKLLGHASFARRARANMFESIISDVVNVHLRGSLREDRWFLDSSSFGFYEALDLIRNKWKYSGLFTVEPEGKRDRSLFDSFVKAMRALRTNLRSDAEREHVYFLN